MLTKHIEDATFLADVRYGRLNTVVVGHVDADVPDVAVWGELLCRSTAACLVASAEPSSETLLGELASGLEPESLVGASDERRLACGVHADDSAPPKQYDP
jgi:hypothetical protein